MIALIVTVHVKKEYTDKFTEISLYNSENSLKEPGCLRFDVLRQCEDGTVFNLYEIYNAESDLEYHRSTDHYKKWRADVENMMSAPRSAVKAELVR